jgi:hypothetical protein
MSAALALSVMRSGAGVIERGLGTGRSSGARRRLAVVALQQRIALKLGVDIGVQLNARQLQQLDRLLQLRRDDQAPGPASGADMSTATTGRLSKARPQTANPFIRNSRACRPEEVESSPGGMSRI